MSTTSPGEIIRSDALTDPLRLQAAFIDELAGRVGDGTVIVDPNSPIMNLIEGFSRVTADALNAIVANKQALYVRRAASFEDLFRHMSDFDYLGLYSAPADSHILLYFDPTYLQDNAEALEEGSIYRLVTIPEGTIFKVGNLSFGIHYPIKIMINSISGVVSASWDETVENPLYNLSQNTIECRTQTANGISLLCLRIPVQQFVRTTYLEEVATTTGVAKVYDYTDGKFYAIRVYYQKSDQTWAELAQTLTNDLYDPETATALITVMADRNKVKVTIPQVYFSEGMVSTKLKVEIYTTQGAVDVEFSDAETTTAQVSFPSGDSSSAILSRLKTLLVVPAEPSVIGGSNGLTFEELKQRIINSSLTSGPLVTSAELSNYFKDQGFTISRYQDGITNRIYRCYRLLTDSADAPIAAATLRTKLDLSAISNVIGETGYSSRILKDVDGSVMILPTALFLYDEVTKEAIPLSDAEIAALDALSATAKIAAYNDHVYTHIPFHLKMHYSGRYPVAYSYDLYEPSIDRIEFNADHPKVVAEISLRRASIEHLDNGTGGYRLTVEANVSAELANVDWGSNYGNNPAALAFVQAYNELGDPVYVIATYSGMTSTGQVLFTADLATNYTFSIGHRIRLTGFKDEYDETGHDFALTTGLEVLFLLNKNTPITTELDENQELQTVSSLFSSEAEAGNIDEDVVMSALAKTVYPDHVRFSKQTLTVTFGRLIAETDNPVTVEAAALSYATRPATTYVTYLLPEYLKDSNDVYVADLDPGATEVLQEIRALGEWKFHDDDHIDFTVDVIDDSGTRKLSGFLDVSMLAEGMEVLGSGIALGTLITAVDTGAKTVSIDDATATVATDVKVRIGTLCTTALVSYAVDTVSGSAVVSGFILANLSNLAVGMAVTGPGIPEAARISDIDTENLAVTLTAAATATANNVTCTFGNWLDYKSGVVEYAVRAYLTGFESLATFTAGMSVESDNLPPGTTITEVGAAGLILSNAPLVQGDGVAVLIGELGNTTAYVVTVGKTTYVPDIGETTVKVLALSSVAQLAVGMCVNGPLIPAGAIVDAIDALNKRVILDAEPTELAELDASYCRIGYPQVKYAAGDPYWHQGEQDESTYEQVAEALNGGVRQLVYHVEGIHVDAKFDVSTLPEHEDYMDDLVAKIKGFFSVISAASERALENTSLFFQPTRTIGTAVFKTSQLEELEHPLALTFALNMYVSATVFSDETTKALIRSTTLKIIDAQLATGSASCTKIATEVLSQLSDVVQHVDILGINGVQTRQTLIALEDAAYPNLQQRLAQSSDGSLIVERGLTINFISL